MNPIASTNENLKFIAKIIIISFFIIIFRLLYLQIYLNETLFNLSKKNFTRIIKIPSLRGNIVDINGNLLATNRPLTNVYWQGSGNKNLKPEHLENILNIQKILNKELTENDLKNIKYTERYSKNFLLANDITFDQLSKISEQFSTCPNIYLETTFQRYYPNKRYACHILGYLGQIDVESLLRQGSEGQVGKMGLEKIFEEDLKGKSGTALATINSIGKKLGTQEIEPASTGKTIQTTIDLKLQKLAEELFPIGFKGTWIIMDPKNGAIKTLVSRPNFDPSYFLKSLTLQEWNELQEQQPFLNRAFNATYPPASIFKLVTVTAALDLGIVTKDSHFNCVGFVFFGNRHYLCARTQGHGCLSTKQAVALSCNPFFYQIAKKIDIDSLAAYARKFGLGSKTGTIFAEKEGTVPTSAWKKKTFHKPWWPGETLSHVIGQGYLLVTPIQIARLVSAIFEGYLVNPRILEEENIIKEPLDIRKDILEFLRQTMRMVVTEGTAIRLNSIRDMTISAKTGTAQTSSLEKRTLGNEYLEHAWFACNFAYKDNPNLTMVMLIENAGSTEIAISTVKQFFIEYKKLINDQL